jgi:hypothetical protein
MVEPKLNKDTGKYEVFLYGEIHEFNEHQESLNYISREMNDFFANPINEIEE